MNDSNSIGFYPDTIFMGGEDKKKRKIKVSNFL